MPPPARGHRGLRHWMATRFGIRLQPRPRPARLGALAYIAAHHGLHARPDDPTPAAPTGMEQLCCHAMNLGLRSRVVRLEAASLHRLQLPCLVQHHSLGWTPLVAVHGDHVTLQDPQQGRIRLQLDAWAVQFSGLALEFRRAR